MTPVGKLLRGDKVSSCTRLLAFLFSITTHTVIHDQSMHTFNQTSYFSSTSSQCGVLLMLMLMLTFLLAIKAAGNLNVCLKAFIVCTCESACCQVFLPSFKFPEPSLPVTFGVMSTELITRCSGVLESVCVCVLHWLWNVGWWSPGFDDGDQDWMIHSPECWYFPKLSETSMSAEPYSFREKAALLLLLGFLFLCLDGQRGRFSFFCPVCVLSSCSWIGYKRNDVQTCDKDKQGALSRVLKLSSEQQVMHWDDAAICLSPLKQRNALRL